MRGRRNKREWRPVQVQTNYFYDAAMLVLKEAVNDKYDYISWWLYEGEPDYKVWSSDNTEEWNLTEPEALYDFIVNECQE